MLKLKMQKPSFGSNFLLILIIYQKKRIRSLMN